MTLHAAVDATSVPGQRLGAGTYVVEMLRAVDPRDAELEVFVKGADAAEIARWVPEAALRPVGVSGRAARILWSHTLLPVSVRRLAPDVFFGPHYTIPAGLRCPSVVTFHDPTMFTLPHLHERKKVAYFTRAARRAMRRAGRIIAVSEYARRGAVEHAGADPERVDVVLEGVDLDRYRPPEPRPREAMILYVGALEPRKDVPTLVEAYSRLDVPHELVLAGAPAWGAAAVQGAVARSAKRSIHVTGYVPEDEKIDLYRRASVFVYPSIAEGFGLPVLEAMACGTPVVTTTGSAPEEVAAGAALLVPPQDPQALAEAIARVLSDEELAADLARRGLERAESLTWKAAASATVEVWRRAAEDR